MRIIRNTDLKSLFAVNDTYVNAFPAAQKNRDSPIFTANFNNHPVNWCELDDVSSFPGNKEIEKILHISAEVFP